MSCFHDSHSFKLTYRANRTSARQSTCAGISDACSPQGTIAQDCAFNE